MEGVKRPQSDQDYGQVVARPVEEGELFPGVFPMEGEEKMIMVGGEGISIPRGKAPDDALKTRSVVAAAVSQNPRVDPPMSWLEFTVENIANLTENEIVQRLSDKGIFDASKLGFMLFLPGGYQMVVRMISVIPGHRLLKLGGEGLVSAHFFAHMLFEKNFFMGDKSQVPTAEILCGTIRAKCKPQLPGSPQEKVDGQAATLAQTMIETYADEGRRRGFENNLRGIVDLIFAKLPPPDMGNQTCWDNIRRAIRDNACRFYGTDGEKKLEELRERFPPSRSTPRPFGPSRVNTRAEKGNEEFGNVGRRFPPSKSTPRPFGPSRVNTKAEKGNEEFGNVGRRFPPSRSTPRPFGPSRVNTRAEKGNEEFGNVGRRFPPSRSTPRYFWTNRVNTKARKGNRRFERGWRNQRNRGVSWRR